MANFFKNLKPKADLSRHGFDLSQRHVFSMPAGALLPVLNLACVPGDYHEIRVSDLVRAMPMQTAAFLRAKQQIDFFFVPYSQLWMYWDSFINQRADKTSALELNHNPLYAPNFSLGGVLQTLYTWNISSITDQNLYPLFHGAIRLLDLLGYGNFEPLMNLTELGDTTISASGRGSTADMTQEYSMIAQQVENTFCNPWPILAYQKIWSDFYRNPYWDAAQDPTVYNLDDVNSDSVDASRVNVGRICSALRLRYRSWKKDYFTSLLPDSQFGGVSIASVSGDFVLNGFPVNTTGSRLGMYQSGDSVGTRIGISGRVETTTYNQSGLGVDILELRKAQALQVWREKVIRAGYRSDANQMAHFGVKPQFSEDSHPLFLGSTEANIMVDDVQATAQTGESVNGKLGDLAGKGVSFQNDSEVIKFNSRDFGVIMAIMSIVPESEYNSVSLDKDKTLIEPFDYYTPEFQNLGLEPVTHKELNLLQTGFNDVVGYAPRYYCYKNSYDKVHGEFCHHNGYFANWRGQFENWATPLDRFQVPEESVAYAGMQDSANQYINPAILDSIFYQAYDGMQIHDQFIVDAHFDIKSVRPMSVLGLPSY